MGRLLCGSLILGLLASAGLAQDDKKVPPAEEDMPPEAPAEPAGKPFLVFDAGGHTSPVNKVLFTPDDRQVITISQDKTIRFWDVLTGRTVRVLRPPIGANAIGELTGGALSPDGKTLAVGSWAADEKAPRERVPVVYLISLASGAIRTLHGHRDVVHVVAFSPNGKRLASASRDKTARIWDVEEGKSLHVLKGHTQSVRDLAFSPDGHHLVTVSGDTTGRIWSVQSGKQEGPTLESHGGPLWCVAWGPDGKTIATGGDERKVRLWDDRGRSRGIHFPDPEYCALLDLDFNSRDGKGSRELVYTWRLQKRGNDRWEFGVQYMDLATGRCRPALVMHEGSVATPMSTAFSAKRDLAATSGGDNSLTYLWTPSNGKIVHRLESQGKPVFSVGWGADEEGKTTIAWGTSRQPGDRNPPLSASFNLADLTLVTRVDPAKFRGTVRKLGTLSLEHAGEKGLKVKEDDKVLTTVAIPHDAHAFTLVSGDRVAAAGWGNILLYDARTGKNLHTVTVHRVPIRALALSSDGRYLLTGAADDTVRVTTVDDPKVLVSLFVSGNEWVAWTPEGYYAASAGGERLMGWQVNNGPDRLASFYPAVQFRASLYRPDVISRLLAEGSLEKALAAADREKGVKDSKVLEVKEVLPPRVKLVAPKLKADGKTAEPKIEVEATAQGTGKLPVVSLQLMLDGRPYQGSGGLRKVTAKAGEPVTEKWVVELPEGEHTLRAVARSEASMGMSEDLDITYTQPVPRPHLYLLAVGIDAYPAPVPKLNCAVADARELQKTFQERSKDLFEVDYRLLTDKEATRADILKGLAWLKANMKPHDQAVIFYAGHGEQDGKSFYLLPQDVNVARLAATGISGDLLKQHLADLPGKVLLLLDACHSGAIGKVINEMARDLADDDCGVVVMCAALGREKAGEADGHGFFCKALIEALEGKGQKNPSNGRVYQHHVEQYVIDRVQSLSHDEQHPTTAKPTLPPFPLAKP